MVKNKYLFKILLMSLLVNCSHFSKKNEVSSSPQEPIKPEKLYTKAPDLFVTDGNSEHLKIDDLYIRSQADYNFAVGEAFALEGDSTKAIEAYKSTLIYDPQSVMIHIRLAGEYLKLGSIKESLDYAEKAVQIDSKNIEAQILLGGIFSSMKLYNKALKCYEAVLKLDPKNTEAPLYLGALYTELNEPEKAFKYFESLSKNPQFENTYLAYYYMARVRMAQSDLKYKKSAELLLKKSLDLKPEFQEGVLALYSLYLDLKELKKGIASLTFFQKDQGPSVKIAEVLGQYYAENEMYDEAYEQYEIISRSDEMAISTKMKMALILMDKKIYDKAIETLEQILAVAPESDKVRFYLAAIFEEIKQNDKALEQFQKVSPASQYYGESIVHMAYLLKQKNEINKALSIVDGAINEKPDQVNLYVMKASLLDDLQIYKNAISTLELAKEKFPQNAQVQFYLGTLHDKVGNKNQMVSSMKRVIELEPDHIQGLNYLAFTWAEDGKNLDLAENLARRAVQLDPQDGFVLDTLGWVLYKQGKYAESIQVLESAHNKMPKIGVIAEHLGDAYSKKILLEKAKGMYQKALENETDDKKINDLQGKISAINDQKLNPNRMPASLGGR